MEFVCFCAARSKGSYSNYHQELKTLIRNIYLYCYKKFLTSLNFFTMDSIKSKMLSLSQATSEALARTSVFEEELRRNNEIADRFEEQVKSQRGSMVIGVN